MTTVAFFNNKGGVGKTALVSHVAWMFASRGVSALAVDLDPQANLSSMLLDEQRIVQLANEEKTIRGAIFPLLDRSGDVAPAYVQRVAPNLSLVAGDLRISLFEDLLAENWGKCLQSEPGAFRVVSAFYRVIRRAMKKVEAKVALIDLGPNLGPLNRAALLSAANIVLPVAPDLFSLQGMENLGPTLRSWRTDWKRRIKLVDSKSLGFRLPPGRMRPIGYVLMSFGVRDNRPVKAYDDWMQRIPETYRTKILGLQDDFLPPVSADKHCIATLKHYRSLMPLAMAAHKPMFGLKASDGARGAHLDAVQRCYEDFLELAHEIGQRIDLDIQ